MTTLKTIPCPRCYGHGSRPAWLPDQGVCYRCHGLGSVDIDTAKYHYVLRMLRQLYQAEQRNLVSAELEGDTRAMSMACSAMDTIKENGLRVRRALELAGVLEPLSLKVLEKT